MGIIGGLIPKSPDEEDIPGGPFTEAERKLLRRYLRDERRATWAWGLFRSFVVWLAGVITVLYTFSDHLISLASKISKLKGGG